MPIIVDPVGYPGIIIDEPAAPNNLDTPQRVGAVRYSKPPYPYSTAPNALIQRITYRQRRALWVPLQLGNLSPYTTPAPFGEPAMLIEETDQVDVGGGVVEWDRVFATLPWNFDEPAVVTKNYQWVQYTFAGAVAPPIGAQVISYSRALSGRITHAFFRDREQLVASGIAIPPVPFVVSWENHGFLYVTDFGSGFPQGSVGPPVPSYIGYTNNYFVETIVGGSIEPYLGRMLVMKVLKAT